MSWLNDRPRSDDGRSGASVSGHRPHRATNKPDANHWMVRDYLRDACGGFESHQEGGWTIYSAMRQGMRVWAMDTHVHGGVYLDWIIGCSDTGRQLWLEVKTPEAYVAKDSSLRDGEKYTLALLGPACSRVVVTDEQVQAAFMYALGAEQ